MLHCSQRYQEQPPGCRGHAGERGRGLQVMHAAGVERLPFLALASERVQTEGKWWRAGPCSWGR